MTCEHRETRRIMPLLEKDYRKCLACDARLELSREEKDATLQYAWDHGLLSKGSLPFAGDTADWARRNGINLKDAPTFAESRERILSI